MKKTLFICSLLSLLICGCGSNNPSATDVTTITTSNNSCDSGVTTVPLTMDNIPTYFNVVKSGRNGYNGEDFTISFKGVLTFAIYENVVVTLNMHVYAPDDSYSYIPKNDDYERQIQLNAAGEGSSTLYNSDGKIDHIIDIGIGTSLLMYYECTWSIKAISGSVKYRL